MRCNCCDKILSDMEATSKFVDGRFTEMCTKCQGYLPPDVKVVVRRDLTEVEDVPYVDDLFLEGEEDGYEEN